VHTGRCFTGDWYDWRLADVEDFLELDHQLPVVVSHVLLEVLLQCIDSRPGHLGVQGVRVVELAAVVEGGVVGALDADRHLYV
jgi:hypothetical protein